ncbi:MAG: NUDIX domain-containing protein [Christensenellaceae bacterium]|jgi:NADH pyrophosphatase NudC (nudix superfamily)|nr:NUDIX domain-containing protein [Christensenellaceae bacterium]
MEKIKEVLDLFNGAGEFLEKTIEREQNISEGEFVKLVLIWIKNSKGQFLIQKTSKKRGGVYAVTGGHVKSGQSCEEACISEIEEELGITAVKRELNYVGSFPYKNTRLFYTYCLLKEIDCKKLKYQKEEVDFAVWKNAEEIRELIENGELRETSVISFDLLKTNY